MKRIAKCFSLFVLAAMTFFFNPFAAPGEGEAATKVRVAMSWVLAGDSVPEFVALEKGFFAAEGIKTTIQRGHGAVDTLKRVAAGELDLGSSVLVSVALGRASGMKAKIIKVSMHTSPYGLAYMKGIGINQPKDLEGKKVAIPIFSSVLQFWPAFAKVNGIDRSKVEMINLKPALLGTSLASGLVHAVDSWLTSLPPKEAAARKMGKEAGFFLWSDYGLSDMYGASYVAREDTIANKPEMLQKFINASIRGLVYAHQHPKESVEIFLKHNAAASRSLTDQQWKYMKRLSTDENFKKEGFGYVNAGKMDKAMKLIRTYVGLKKPVAAQGVYTNQFVERVPRKYRFPKLP